MTIRTRSVQHGKLGFTLIETMVGLTVGLIGLMAFIKVISDANRLSKKSLSAVDISSIKRNVFAGVNCEATFKGLTIGDPCNGAPRYIDLKSADGKILVSANGTSSGNFVVRAYCSDGSGRGLDVRAVKLLPEFKSNVEDISWVGKSLPTNPDHYMADESRSINLKYDWNHPNAIISTPGAGGLCVASFQAATVATSCSGSNAYVKSINFDTKGVTCGTIPVCAANESLEFSGSSFTCSAERYNTMVNYFYTFTNSQIPGSIDTINSYRDSAVNTMNYVYNRFGQLGSWSNGTTVSIGASSDSGCAKLSNGSCPDGYLMYGYEARQQGSGSCHASCVKIAPP